jgi:predicted metal-dependent hydrolase
VPLRGVPHRIVHRGGARGLVRVATGEDGTPELQAAGELPHLERRLTDFFKAEAKRDLVVAVARHAGRLGKPVKRIVVRDQTSRWGSCSSSAVLSFSWRLVLAPPWILDYLAAHEVAHLAEMNHGPRFWHILKDLCPETDRAKAWLRANGVALHAMGPAAGKAPDAEDV